MSAFSSIDIARTGVGFSHFWMDTIAHNVANVNTVTSADEEPFRAQMVVAREATSPGEAGAGVQIGGLRTADEDPIAQYDPTNPLANEQGYVNQANVDLSAQMSDMIVANRSYQANLRTIQSAREAYEAALRLGQSR